MNKNFWKNKKVLITGNTGFKGSWLTIWLKKMNADIIGYSNSIPTNPSLFELAKLENEIESIVGDIKDYNLLKQVIEKYQPDIVFHMAAQSLVLQSYLDPIETYSTNVMGTVNILNAIREIKKTKVIVNVTSDKCYENNNSITGFTEGDPMGGHDPYSSSKGCAELITKSFRESFFGSNSKSNVALASVRAGNVIGGGDWAENRLIPDIIRGIKKEEKIKIRNPNAIRPWQHVLDPLSGYIHLAEKLWDDKKNYAEGWNFGPDEKEIKSVSWIIEKITELWDSEIEWGLENEIQYEANNLILNCQKAKTKLLWQPEINIETALKWTIEWYKRNFEGEDMKKVTEEQITRFESFKAQ